MFRLGHVPNTLDADTNVAALLPNGAPLPFDAAPAPDSPALYTNFYGTGVSGFIPPDTDGAVGTNLLMIMINGRVRIRDRSGAPIFLTNLNDWWRGAGTYTNDGQKFTFDPHVLYDPYNDRWIAVAAANGGDTNLYSQLLIGVSATSDPTGTWYQYAYNVDTNRQSWADYPEIGFNKDKIVVTFTRFVVTNGAANGSRMYVFDKNSFYAGTTPIYSASTLAASTYGYFLQPAITYDTNISTEYMVQSSIPNSADGYGYVGLYAVTGTATNVTVTKVGNARASAWNGGFSTNHGPQLGTNVRVDTGDNRAQQAVYRSGSIWFAHTIGLPAANPNRSAIQFWQLGTNSPPTLIQTGRIQDTTATTNYAYPTIAVNRFGDSMIGFSMFATNMYPSAGYTFQSALTLEELLKTWRCLPPDSALIGSLIQGILGTDGAITAQPVLIQSTILTFGHCRSTHQIMLELSPTFPGSGGSSGETSCCRFQAMITSPTPMFSAGDKEPRMAQHSAPQGRRGNPIMGASPIRLLSGTPGLFRQAAWSHSICPRMPHQ